MEWIEAKSILQKVSNPKDWFGCDYNMNLYRGCSHGCIYCDSRSSCYQVENFDRIRGKKNAIFLLQQELAKKRKKGVIGIGAMSDSYNPLENKYRLTRQALTVIEEYGFGISLETKSDLVTRDIDVLQNIQKRAPVIIKLTITAASDVLSQKIEPNVCPSSKRWEAIHKLAEAGIFCGVLITPVLPFITDTEENIKEIIRLSYLHGAKFVFCMGGVTLRQNQRDYYFEQLDQKFPSLKQRYIHTYGEKYMCPSLQINIRKIVEQECHKYGLLYQMKDIIHTYQKIGYHADIEQLSFFEND